MASTLKVNTIAHTGGTTGMTIDSSGNVIENNYMIDQWRLNDNTNNGTNGAVASNWERVDTNYWSGIGNQMQEASGLFTFPRTGLYLVTFHANLQLAANQMSLQVYLQVTPDNGANYTNHARADTGSPLNSGGVENQSHPQNIFMQSLVNVTNVSTYRVRFENSGFNSGTYFHGNTTYTASGVIFERKGPSQ